MKKLLFITFFITIAYLVQAQSPIITGTVKISVKQGTFDCDLTISDIPYIKDYLIRMNSGMNILNFQSVEPEKFLLQKLKDDTRPTWEATSYFFEAPNGEGKYLPKSLRVRYVGKFPVATDTLDNYSAEDWKGNIAFNGYSVRTDGAQCAWYPILYDIQEDKSYSNVRYNIEIIAEDAEIIYINGSTPKEGSQGNFKSDTPVDMALFAGNFDRKDMDGTFFLNSGLTDSQFQQLGEFTKHVKEYYANQLKIEYGNNLTFVKSTPTSKHNAWMFVSFPTIMYISHGSFQSLFNKQMENKMQHYFAHEFAHYYFGTYRVFNSELGDLLTEGFAEYLATKVSMDLLKESEENKINEKISRLTNFEPIQLEAIRTNADYKNRELYSYNYTPLLLLAIEKEIGMENMLKWTNKLLTNPSVLTNYHFVVNTLEQVVSKSELELIKQKYFESDNSLENIINRLTAR